MHLTAFLSGPILQSSARRGVTKYSNLPSQLQHILHRPGQSPPLQCAKESSRSLSLCRANGNTLQTAADHSKRSIDLEPQAEGEYCMPGEVTFDNEAHEKFTLMQVEVKDYPGLLRVIAWVLNGLQLVVQNARLITDKSGTAKNVFWITTDGGRKLDNARAELVAERVGDYVVYCTPDKHATEAQEFREGAITLSNCVHEEYSVVDVTSGPDEKGFLLEVASAMTGLGVTIHEAIVQGCSDCGGPEIDDKNFVPGRRLFRFWVTDRRGDKLDYQRCTALLYTMGLLLGQSRAPLRPPGTRLAVNGDMNPGAL